MKDKVAMNIVWVGMIALLVITGCAGPASSVVQAPVAPSMSALGTGDEPVPAATATPEGLTGNAGLILSEALPVDYADALSARNQLALGSLRLAETEQAITPEQASTLRFLWQALKTLDSSDTAASEETGAVQAQILETMTADQVSAIAAMKLTNEDLTAFYGEQGLVVTTPEPGVTPQGGRRSGMSQEEREAAKATSQAQGTPVGTGGGGGGGAGAARRDILLDSVIAYLAAREP